MSTNHFKYNGATRTDLYCHACNKNFSAIIDYDLDGLHIVECIHCGHYHYRKIEKGIVTSERYDSDSRKHVVEKRNMWKHNSLPIQTSSASHFIRDRWLNTSN